MKYFIISDIHSHYSAMITALNNEGYNSDNSDHHLLVLGDLFDRGTEALEVLDYLHTLSIQDKATILLGNHDKFLLDFLEGVHGRVLFNIARNGFGKTLEQLSGMVPNEDNLQEVQLAIEVNFPYLCEWLSSFQLYLEIENYVFVHGGIDGKLVDWKNMSTIRDFTWGREYNLDRIPGKIVVAGHHRVATIRQKTKDYDLLYSTNPELFDIMYEDGKILIDRFVEVSKEINILTLDLKALK